MNGPRYKSLVIRRQVVGRDDPLDVPIYYVEGKHEANEFDWLLNQQAGGGWELVSCMEISVPANVDPAYRLIFTKPV